ncbi:hypothetical protein [Desertibaculum subflavum]|uniref:hypothetical protein n=1 Tax=Desertibaculum subflavum TaxID=2268458 RepID=UPI000E6695DB
MFLAYVDSMRKDEFEKIVRELTPRWIIDVRAVPRLDTIASSRSAAFALFERCRAHYVDLFGRLGIKSYRAAESNPAFWGRAVFELLNGSERKGPYLFLFDNRPLLQIADKMLLEAIKPAVGKAAHIARLEHETKISY